MTIYATRKSCINRLGLRGRKRGESSWKTAGNAFTRSVCGIVKGFAPQSGGNDHFYSNSHYHFIERSYSVRNDFTGLTIDTFSE